MKKVISLVLSVVMLLSITAGIDLSVYADCCGDDAFCTFDEATGLLTISGTGEIESYAFYQKKDVKSVIINSGITSIGDKAFYGSGLEEITIPYSVTSIENEAFSDCENLTSIIIPNSVVSMGDRVFSHCENLTSIILSDNVTNIGNYAFSSCYNLTSIILSDNVTNIGNYAFSFCKNLTSITIPNSVVSMGDSVFYACDNLTRIILSNNITNIGDGAFESCKKLTNITIPNSVTSIGNSVFARCESLTSIAIPNGVTKIGYYAFLDCRNLINVIIPSSVTSIDYCAFMGCESLTSIAIPNSVTTIGARAFECCYNLKSVTIPDGVESIEMMTFEHCGRLISVKIPKSVRKIADRAFNWCSSLSDVYYTGDESSWESISISSGAFRYEKVIHYNVSDAHEYKFFNIIEPTCLEEGYKIYRCPCGYERKEDILPPLGHNYEKVEVIKPTCTEKGYTKNKCSVCGDEIKDNYKSALGHRYELKETVEPTCQNEGYNIHRCVCGLEKTETLAALDHTYELLNTVEATCLTEGYKKYECACGTEKTEIIPYAEHNFVNGICKNCSILKSDFVESKHPYTSNLDQNWIINKPNAKFIRITFSSSTVTESKHDFIYIYDKNETLIGCYSGSELAAKSVIVKGDTVEIRLITDNTNNQYGFALSNVQVYYECPHTESKFVKTVAPTCTNKGYSLYNCSYCGEQYKVDIVKAKGHSYDNGKVTKKATCKATGVKTYTCQTCGAAKTETIAKAGHTYKNVVTKATLSKNGKIDNKCSVCGKVSKTTIVYYPKTIKLSKSTFVYNGKAQKPSVIVKDSKGNTLKLNKDYTVSHSNASSKNVGKYTVTIKFKGNYTGTKTIGYHINPKGTEFVPSNKGGFKAISKGFTLKWNKQASQTTGYQIQYATKSDFSNAASVTITNTNTTSYTFKNKAGGKRYYVRIRTYKKANGKTYFSAWNSGTKSVVTLK